MKIFVLSDVIGHGGASMIANGLSNQWGKNHEIYRRYLVRAPGDLNPLNSIPKNKYLNYAIHRTSKQWLGPIGRGITRMQLSMELEKIKPDIISLHNIHAGDGNHDLVAACLDVAPTVWTLHDMWSFTGRCAYSYGCMQFTSECNASCPTPKIYPALDPKKISRSWHKRKDFFEKYKNIVGVTPSKWLGDLAKMGFWENHRVEVINNGIDLSKFQSVNKEVAQQAIGVQKGKAVISAYVGIKGDPFKTPEILESALNQITTPLHVITFGPGKLTLNHRHSLTELGSIGSSKFLSIAYSCGDLFVLPSEQENFPTVLLEALACEVPVVAFDVGGNKEIIANGVNGWVVDKFTSESLSKTILDALDGLKSAGNIRSYCRQIVHKKFNVVNQADIYLKLFGELNSR